jgi:hypothetical protein
VCWWGWNTRDSTPDGGDNTYPCRTVIGCGVGAIDGMEKDTGRTTVHPRSRRPVTSPATSQRAHDGPKARDARRGGRGSECGTATERIGMGVEPAVPAGENGAPRTASHRS